MENKIHVAFLLSRILVDGWLTNSTQGPQSATRQFKKVATIGILTYPIMS